MPQFSEGGIGSLLEERLGVANAKQADVAAASKKKQNQFNPLNYDNLEHVDGDTWKMRDTGQLFRASGPNGASVDTYESDPDRYLDQPERFKAHRRNYAKLTGRPEWTITRGELAERGKVQAHQTKQRMDELGKNGQLSFRVTGVDDYGRQITELINNETGGSVFEDHAGIEQNASYDSKYNAEQRLRDLLTGKKGEREAFTGSRSWWDAGKDQPVNLAVGAGRMLNDIAQSVSVITGTNSPGANQFFSNNRSRLDRFKAKFASDEQQGRERLAQANAARMDEAYAANKAGYIENGDSPTEASIKAGIDQFGHSVRSLIQNPGRILDATVESLPYMLGVSAVGKTGVKIAADQLKKRALANFTKAGAGEASAAKLTARWLKQKGTQKILSRTATALGVTTVGLTEGLSTSAEVYDSILGMSQEEAMQSEKYQALRFDQGKSHREALEVLAEEAFDNTLGPVILLAATAGLVTGAAGFESKLFTSLAGARGITKGVAKEAVKQGVIKSSAKAVGRGAVQASKPGLKETAEELAQSGGGELLSQIGKAPITGEEVGPGVGTAAGEGAVVGFASGFGAGAVSNSVKKLAEARLTGNDFLKKKASTPENVVPPDGGRPGGESNPVQEEIDQAKKADGYDSGEAFKAELDTFYENAAKEDGNPLQNYNRLKSFYQDALAEGKVSSEDTEAFNQVKEIYGKNLSDLANQISKKDEETLSPEDQAVINEAAENESIPKAVKDRLPEDAQQVIQDTEELNELRVIAEQAEDPTVTAQVTGQTEKAIDRVHNEKFGDGIGSTGPGLGWYFNEMSDIMADPDKNKKDSRFLALSKKLAGFIASQDRKIAKYQAVLENPEGDHGKLKFVPQKNGQGGTQGFVENLQKENDAMAAIRDKLLVKYRRWNGKDNPQIQKLADDLAPEPLSQPPSTPAATETVPEASPVDENTPEPLSEPPQAQTETETPKAEPKEDKKADEGTLNVLNVWAGTNENANLSNLAGRPFTYQGKKYKSVEHAYQSLKSGFFDDATYQKYLAPNAPKKIAGTQGTDKATNLRLMRRLMYASFKANPKATEELLATGDATITHNQDRGIWQKEFPKALEAVRRVLAKEAKEAKAEPAKPKRKRRTNNVVELDPNAPFELNADQKAAYEAVFEFLKDKTKKTFSIIGSAGTGKTTLVNEILAKIKKDTPRLRVKLTTPTHRANSVIRSKNPREEVVTLHSLLGLKPNIDLEKFDARNLKFVQDSTKSSMPYGGLVIVDESSMINDFLYEALTNAAEASNTRVIFLGDMAQLGPVKQETDSKALSDTDGQAILNQVMRAKNVELLDESIDVREDGDFTNESAMDENNNGVFFTNDRVAFVDMAVEFFKSPAFKENPMLVRVLAFRNATVSQYNNVIRKRLHGADAAPYVEGELLMGYSAFNEDTIANGLDYIVDKVNGTSKGKLFDVEVDVISLSIREIISGKRRRVEVVDPHTAPAVVQEVARNAAALINDARNNRSLWKRFYAQKEKYALPFDLINVEGNRNQNIIVKTLDYGYSHTIHKSQGGTYEFIMLNANDINYARRNVEKERLRYVGLTRAERGAFILTSEEVTNKGAVETVAAPAEVETAQEAEPAIGTLPEGVNVPTIPDDNVEETPVPIAASTAAEPEIGALPEGINVPTIPNVGEDTEQAEAQPAPATVAEPSQAQKLATQNRVDAARRLQSKITNDTEVNQVVLSSKRDNDRLQILLENTTPVEAIEQLISEIQPDPNAPRIATPKLPKETLDHALETAATLNEPGGRVPASSFPAHWQSFVSDTAEMLRKLKGAFTSSSRLEDLSLLPGKIIAAFKRHNLPTGLDEVFTKRSSTVTSLLASVPNFMGLLENVDARNKLYTALKLSPSEERAMETYRAFHRQFATMLENTRAKLDLTNTNAGRNLQQDALTYFEDENGQLDPNVVAAMSLEAMIWTTTSGPQTTWNTPEDINGIFGRTDSDPISDKESEIFTRAGTLRNTVANEIANAAFRHLNMKDKRNSDINPLFRDKLVASMGSHMITVLINNGNMKQTQVDREWFLEQKKKRPENETTVITSGEAKVNFVRNNIETVEVDGEFKNLDSNRNLTNALYQGHNVFGRLFGATPTIRMPSFEQPTLDDVPTTVSRILTKISDFMRGRMLHNTEQSWRADTKAIDVLSRFNSRQFLKMAMGFIDEAGMASVHVTQKDSVKGRNDGLERDLQAALDWNNEHGGKNFWFNYVMNRSGRVNINSNVINPQASKIHRWLFGMDAWEETISRNPKVGDKRHQNFLIAVGAGLGINTDKLTRAAALERITNALESEGMDEVLQILAEDSVEKFTPEQVAKLEVFLDPPPTDTGEKIGGEGVHTLAALTAYAKFKYGEGDTVTINLPMETDGITNGFIAGLLQTPPANYGAGFKEMLRAGGVYFENDPWTNFPTWKGQGNRDNYQQIADRVSQFLGNMVNKAYNNNPPESAFDERNQDIQKNADVVFSSGFLPSLKNLVLNEGRKWAKNPLMVVAYGASIGSVIRAITQTSLNEFYTQLGKANTVEEVAEVISRFYSVANMVNDANEAVGWKKIKLNTASVEVLQKKIDGKAYGGDVKEFATNFKLRPEVIELFENGVRHTYGAALGRALKEKIGPLEAIRSQLNHANKLMNLIFVQDFLRRVTTLEKTRGTTLSPDDRKAIFMRMHKEGLIPSVATAASTNRQENLETTSYDTQYLGGPDGKGEAHLNGLYDLIERAFTGAEGTATTPKAAKSLLTRIMSNMPDADVGVSGVVKMIHSLDGVNNSEAWGTQWGVLNIHDAQVGNFNQIDDIARATNKNFVEMHGKFSLADEILKSTFHMMTLMNANDSRLSVADKNAVYKTFAQHLNEFGAISDEQLAKGNPRLLTEEFLMTMQTGVTRTNVARKKLFAEIAAINQFAKEGAEHIVTENAVSGVNEDPIIHDRSTPIKELLTRYFNSITPNADLATREAVIENLLDNLQNDGDINQALRDYVTQAKPRAKELLEVLQAVYTRAAHPAGKNMALLNNLLSSYLGNKKTQVASVSDPEASSTYGIASKTITFDPTKSKNMVRDAMHEIVHAGTVDKIAELEQENPEAYKALLEDTKNWIRINGKNNTAIAHEIRRYLKDKPSWAIAEYIAYTMTEAKDSTGRYDLKFPFLLREIGKVLENPVTGNVILRSSGEATNAELFRNEVAEMLEADTMQLVFDKLAELEQGPVDPEHQNDLNNVLNELVVPGLKSLEATIQQVIAVDPYATKHIGEADGDLIRLQAAGNQLTSNVDMSLQEVAVHEYLHPILKHGIRSNHFLRKEVTRLYELAKANITPDMLVPERVVGDPDIALEKATDRWNYIFNNPETGYDEFLSIGLTNKPLMDALKTLDNRNITHPILGKGILNAMFEVARRIIQFVGGQSRETHGGSAHMALTALAKTIIAENQRNLQRVQEVEGHQDPTYWVNRANKKAVETVANRITDPLKGALDNADRKKLDPKNPTVEDFAKSATVVGLRLRNKNVREEYNRFYRELGGKKNNWFFEISQEFTSWSEQNLGTDEAPGWMDLLRKSKVVVDMARENMASHTRAFLTKSLDKNNYLTSEAKQAVTRVMMKTDISSLMAGDSGMTVTDIQDLLNNPDRVTEEIGKLHSQLRQALDQQGARRLMSVFENQANSLANFMVHGETTLENPMLNAHNIVNQFMLADGYKVSVNNKPELISLLDRMISLKALDRTPVGDKNLALTMVNHEMARVDVPEYANGFGRLLGMQVNFRDLAQERLFDDDPVQMIKGYTYEIFDGDINVEYARDDENTRAEMAKKGMRWVATLEKDSLDTYTYDRGMYIGAKGLASYNKSIVSLTDMQHRGTNLFEAMNYTPQQTYRALERIRTKSFAASNKQFTPGYTKPGTNMVPVLNSSGEIVDYRYMMSERNKQKILKKQDPFDRVLPRMFASITDRNSTKDINRDVVDLMWDEYDKLEGNGQDVFVEISKHGDAKGKEMWNLLPTDMQRYANEKFGGDFMYVRDDVVNLVLGFRKMSIANHEMFGKSAPIVRMAEKVWQEIVQLMRVKIATQTPRVVIGNMASNTAMLLSEGIRPSYIRQKGTEAISAMRQYQKDVRRKDELRLQIGSESALGRDTTSLEAELGRIRADIELNPVGELVGKGLFTSIAEDLGVTDDSIRQSLVTKFKDKTKGIIPGVVTTAAQEAYMLPGSQGYKAGIAATQYGDFVARYIKYKHDTQVKKIPVEQAVNDSLAAFIYYDIPQHKVLQMLNDNGLIMFTKFFLRIQPIVARMYTQNPVGALGVLGVQAALLPKPFSENIAQYGLGSGLTHKPIMPWNLPGKVADTLPLSEPSLLQWVFNPFGL